jgi:endonuclease YncB( thermonuclease family)
MTKTQRKRLLGLIIGLLVLGFIWLGQQFGWLEDGAQKAQQNQPGLYAVTRFVDGDTITVDMNGTPETIRMIGVDTPETHDPDVPVQCYGPAASAYTKNLIGEQRVRLEADPTKTATATADYCATCIWPTAGWCRPRSSRTATVFPTRSFRLPKPMNSKP